MLSSYSIAVIQLNSQPDVDESLHQAAKLIDEAASAGARLIALPEHMAFLGDFDKRLEHAETIGRRARQMIVAKAREHECYICGGSFPVPARNGKVFNRILLVTPGGETALQYDKIHLFDVDLEGGESYRESKFVEPGEPSPAVFASDEMGNIGLSICYDLRFPELYRGLSAEGAEVLMVPSAFTRKTGRDHWKPLLRARAIENTAYVVAAAQTGRHGQSRYTYGHSMVIDPWGEVLIEAGTKPGVSLVEINSARLEAVRTSIPSLKHRRLHITKSRGES